MQMKFPLLAALLGLLAAPVSSFAQTDPVEAWKKTLVMHLASKKMYSPNGRPGTAKVMFVIDRSGKLVSSVLVESTGSQALDAAALAVVERSDPFPKPPSELDDDMLRWTVPIVFRGYSEPSPEDEKRLQSWIKEQAKDDAKMNSALHSICRGC